MMMLVSSVVNLQHQPRSDRVASGWTHLSVHSADAQQLATAASVLAALPRTSVFLSLLVHNAGPDAVRDSATAALHTLGVQYVDVLVLEWPTATDHATKVLSSPGAGKHSGATCC